MKKADTWHRQRAALRESSSRVVRARRVGISSRRRGLNPITLIYDRDGSGGDERLG